MTQSISAYFFWSRCRTMQIYNTYWKWMLLLNLRLQTVLESTMSIKSVYYCNVCWFLFVLLLKIFMYFQILNLIQFNIRKLKNGKPPGSDHIPAKLLKADPKIIAHYLHPILTENWQNKYIPEEWMRGFIVKNPQERRSCWVWKLDGNLSDIGPK